jgi:multiple sugar transport system substrate-binding protein
MKRWKALCVTMLILFCFSAMTFSQGSRVNLKGKAIQVTVLGIGGWIPSRLGVDMAPAFAKYAKEKFGYDAKFTFQDAPFSSLYQKAATSLATRSQQFNIIISDSQWLGALSSAGWLMKANDIIKDSSSLKKLEWWDPILSAAYQSYPDYSNELWGFPEEGDVLVMYVRKDLVENSANQAAFKAKYGYDLPAKYEDYLSLTMDKYKQVTEFFTQPEKGLYGIAIQYSKEYDFMTGSLYPFIWSSGGEIWDYKTKNVWGILNTDSNAKALEEMVSFQKFAPPGVTNYGIGQVIDAFTQGKVATAWQWAAAGSGMITPELKDKVLIVPLPGYKVNGKFTQVTSLGGQPWVVNKFNDAAHMQVVKDFLEWWYQADTQLEYARRGGNPANKDVLSSPGFDAIQPWYTTYKHCLTSEHARDFWHVPQYAELLALQQEAFTAFATGSAKDAKAVLDYVAAQQQQILYDAGLAKSAPPANWQSYSVK